MNGGRLAIWVAAGAFLLGVGLWHIDATSEAVLSKQYPQPSQPLAVEPSPSMAAAGARLIALNGCAGCHGAALAGQTAFNMFGTQLTAPNLTALAAKRTATQLAAAIRFGVKPDGTSLIAMPVHRYMRQSDADVAAMIAALKALPSRPDGAPATHFGFTGRFLLAAGIMPPAAPSAVPADRGPLTTPQEPKARGAYILRTQCTMCHGGDLSGITEEHTPDLRFSIAHYSLPAFDRFLHTGVARDGHGTETMTPLIKDRLHNLTGAEVRAIFTYLNNSKLGEKP